MSPDTYRPVFEETIAVLGDSGIYSMLQCAESLSGEEAGKETCEFIEVALITRTDIIMTYGARIRQESMQRGIQQGMQQGLLQVAENMLRQLHIGLDKVQQATGLSRVKLEKIASKA